ncbi:MAG: hypothetical protein ACSLEM_06530 [Candidatus Malihini olakiniferum]
MNSVLQALSVLADIPKENTPTVTAVAQNNDVPNKHTTPATAITPFQTSADER